MIRNQEENRENPTMLDSVLYDMAAKFKTGLAWLNNSYGCSQKLLKKIDNKKIYYPGVYVGHKNYLNLYPDGHLGNYSFFRVNDPEGVEFYAHNVNRITVNFDHIFWFDLNEIYPNDNGRNVDTVKGEVIKVYRDLVVNNASVEYNEIFKESKNIYTGYTFDESSDQYLMHPYGGLMFRGKLIYKEDC